MPKQNKDARTKKQKRFKLILLITAAILALALIGYAVAKEVSKYYQEEQQKQTFTETLADINKIYNEFANSNSYQKEYTQRPENKCSEIGSKSWTKEFSCGTRASLQVSRINEAEAQQLTEGLKGIISSNGELSAIKPATITESTSFNGFAFELDFEHEKVNAECSSSAVYERDKDIMSVDIDCTKINTIQPFPLIN